MSQSESNKVTPITGRPIVRIHFSKENANVEFKNQIFKDVNGKTASFVNCNFSYSVFERAYFRNAVFKNCRFVGARFVDSNFREAHFLQCDFRYAEFKNCLLDPREVVASLPYEPNIRTESLRNLRANASATGDQRSISFLVLQEIDASREHNYRALTGADSYYKQKYPSVLDKAQAALRLFAHYFSRFIWGHGEKPINILLSAVFLLLVIGLINFWSVMPRVGWQNTAQSINVFQYVAELFLGMNPDRSFAGFRFLDYVIVIGRYVYVGLFISVLAKAISHR